MVVCVKRAQLARVILLRGSRTVAHVLQGSLAMKPVLSLVTSVLLAKQTQIRMQLNAFHAKLVVRPILRGVPSAQSARLGSTAIYKEMSAITVQKGFIAAHQT